MTPSTSHCLVLTTASSEEEAERIATALLEAKLAACVNMYPIRSIYTWKGKIQHDREWQLMIKTEQRCVEAIAILIQSIHSYELPELIAMPIIAGSEGYLSWLSTNLMPSD